MDGIVATRFAELVPAAAAITVDEQPIAPASRIVLLMNKPKQHVTARTDAFGRPALAQYLPPDLPFVFPVGRLDFNSEGALLWTNDGALARKVLHPSWSLPKRYGVKIRGHLAEDSPGLVKFRAGMLLPGQQLLPVPTTIIAYRTRATWVEMVLHEGKSRQIRRMCRASGYQIVKLRRLAIGPVELGDLNPRCVRPLREEEIAALEAALTRESPRPAS